MRKGAFGAVAGALCMAPSAPSTRIVEGDGIVAGSVNGASARMQVDPGAPATPLITTAMARRAGLKPGPFAFEYLIGGRPVVGNSAIGRIDSGGGPDKRRIGWTERPMRPGIDGVIGPGMLDEQVVAFRLRAPSAGERRVDFRLIDQGGIDGKWGPRFGVIQVGGRAMRLHFDPHAQYTMATAQAGAHLARTLGGHWDAGSPRQAQIAFGITRPVRKLLLDRPLNAGPLVIASLQVRIQDFGNAGGIADVPPDPEEIVVVAAAKQKPQYDMIKLGADVLDRCSSITFDKRAKRVTLACR